MQTLIEHGPLSTIYLVSIDSNTLSFIYFTYNQLYWDQLQPRPDKKGLNKSQKCCQVFCWVSILHPPDILGQENLIYSNLLCIGEVCGNVPATSQGEVSREWIQWNSYLNYNYNYWLHEIWSVAGWSRGFFASLPICAMINVGPAIVNLCVVFTCLIVIAGQEV